MLYKFQEAVFFSSWGFFLLASPIMIAYGIVTEAPWHYYLLLLPLIISFVYIPCGIGAICCLLVIHKLPNLRKIIVAGAIVAVIAVAGPLIWRTVSGPQSKLFGSEWFQETLYRFRFTQQEWLPSTWLTNGLLEAARIPSPVVTSRVTDLPLVQSCLYLALLISNALFFHVLTVWGAKRWFRASWASFISRRNRGARGHGVFRPHFESTAVPFPTATATLADEGLAVASPGPCAMVPVSDFLRLVGAVFSQRRSLQQSA